MEGLALPCPSCNWLNPLVNCAGFKDKCIKYNLRCTKCGWHGVIKLKADVIKTGEAEVGD